MSKLRITNEDFIKRCKLVHGEEYDLSKVVFNGILNKITVICPIHGEFSVRANSFAYGATCLKCYDIKAGLKRRHSLDKIISKAIDVWGDQFDYSEVVYTGMKDKVIIKCNSCGNSFYQSFDKHINSKQNGCLYCGGSPGWGRTQWVNYCNSKKRYDPLVYVVRFFNNEESFIKIGITCQSISSRMKDIPYQYEVIREIKGSPLFVYDKEIELHRKYREFKYKPKAEFSGFTECFSLDILPLIDQI